MVNIFLCTHCVTIPNILYPLCKSRFPHGVILFLPVGLLWTFLAMWVCCWWVFQPLYIWKVLYFAFLLERFIFVLNICFVFFWIYTFKLTVFFFQCFNDVAKIFLLTHIFWAFYSFPYLCSLQNICFFPWLFKIFCFITDFEKWLLHALEFPSCFFLIGSLQQRQNSHVGKRASKVK